MPPREKQQAVQRLSLQKRHQKPKEEERKLQLPKMRVMRPLKMRVMRHETFLLLLIPIKLLLLNQFLHHRVGVIVPAVSSTTL
jgi:hypothetical protein